MGHEDLKRNVFVSYSRHDFVDDSQNVIPGNCVSKILETFERYGISYWIDKKGIYHGDKFKGVLASAIEAADVFVFISSESSNKSEWTAKEIDVAVYEKKIITTRNRKESMTRLPTRRGRLAWVLWTVRYVARPTR